MVRVIALASVLATMEERECESDDEVHALNYSGPFRFLSITKVRTSSSSQYLPSPRRKQKIIYYGKQNSVSVERSQFKIMGIRVNTDESGAKSG